MGKNRIFKWIATIYIEFVRNVPETLLVDFHSLPSLPNEKSTPAGITAFTIFTTAAMAEIIRGGLNAIGPGPDRSWFVTGFYPCNKSMVLISLCLRLIRKMLPAIISQI